MTRTTEIARRLWKLRDGRGWTQAELSERSGVAREDICRYEAGKRTPTVENLRRLAKALEVSLEALI